MPITVAVIGVGHWHASFHLDALARTDARIVGVAERDATVSERWGARLGCPWFTDEEELLTRARPDLVFALPQHHHAPATLHRLVDRGIPFVMEKPMARNATEIQPLIPLAQARGLFTAVPLVNRYSTFWEEVARLRSRGLLVPLAHASFRIVGGPPDRYLRDGVPWVLDPALSGGGALRNLGIHAADALLVLTGAAAMDVEVLAARTSHRLYQLPSEDFATALLRLPDGLTVSIESGYTYAHPEGSDKEWRVAGLGGYVIERGGELLVATETEQTRRTVPGVVEHYQRFARETLDRFRRGVAPVADLADGWQAAMLIDRIYQAAQGDSVAGR